MNVRSIFTTATLASVATLVSLGAGCSAPAGEPQSTGNAALMGNGGSSGGGGGGGDIPISCGGYESFDSSSFDQALKELGCSMPRRAWSVNGLQQENVSTCPMSGWLQGLVASDSDVAPYYSGFNERGGTTCSNYTKPIPAGYAEVLFDPNCTGADCTSLHVW